MELVLDEVKKCSLSLSYRSFSGFIFWTWNHVTFYVTFFRDFWLHYCHNQTVKLWKYHFERVCQSLSVGFEGEGFQVPASVSPYFFILWVWRKSWWIVLVQMCPFLTVYGYEKYYMTVNIIDMELIMDSLEINSGVSNRPNAKLGIIVR